MTAFHIARAATLVALLGLAASCMDITPPASPAPPALPVTPSPVVPVPSAGGFPAPSHAGDIYQEAGAPYGGQEMQQFHNGTLVSQFVLYRDSTFALQFVSGRFGFFEYRGSYARVDSTITFTWDGWSVAGPWGATGTVRGESLRVAYNNVMIASDFVNGDYVRSAVTP